MEISEVVLFYSKFSKESVSCVQFIQTNRIPVMIIGLDSPEARQKAMTGQTFQIKNVPTLVVSYANREVQLYVGSPKIMGWFQKILNNPNKHEKKSRSAPEEGNSEEENSEEENSEEETVIEPPKKSKSHSSKKISESKKHVKKPKKKRGNKVELIMDYDENSSGNNSGNNDKKSQKLNTQISGLSTSRTSEKLSNSNVMNMARQMEMEREKTLGYKDDK